MAWNCYLTIFKAEAPVHIGYKQIGILKITRYYITGRAIWGAITANLTRALFGSPDSNTYQAVGNFVKENIKTTYFYPAVKEENGIDVENLTDYCVNTKDGKFGVFLPEYKDNDEENCESHGLYFGMFSKEEFEQIFVGSFISTALEPSIKTAEERSLHEFEFIKNKVKINNNTLNVYWIGYLFVKENEKSSNIKVSECLEEDFIITSNSESKNFKEVIKITFVGGERNYGFGRLKLLENDLRKSKDKLFGKFDFELKDKIIFKNMNVAISHIKLNNKKEFKLEAGEIEPLVGLEWSEKGAGQRISEPIVCIAPGSKIETKDFILIHHGILE